MAKTNDYVKKVLGEGNVGQRMVLTVKLSTIYAHPPGHPLRHVRMDDAFDPKTSEEDAALVDSVAANGFHTHEPLLVRFEEAEGAHRPALAYGSRRYRAALLAQERMRRSSSPHLDKDGDLKVAVLEFRGTDADFLYARQQEDAQPLKRPHTTRVLCMVIAQMAAQNVQAPRILEVMPRSWLTYGESVAIQIITAVVTLWHTVHDTELLKRLEHDAVPPGLLPEVLQAKSADRHRVLDELLATGAVRPGDATKVMKRVRVAEALAGPAVDDPDAPPFEEDGLDLTPTPGPAPKPKHRVRVPVAAVKKASPQVVKRLVADLGAKTHTKAEERAFVAGVQCGLGRDRAVEYVVPLLESMAPTARALACGVLYALGAWGPKVQAGLDPAVFALVAGASKPAAQGSKKTKTKRGTK